MKPWLSRSLLVAFGLTIGTLAAEVGLRLIGFSAVNFYRPDPIAGWTHRAETEGWWHREGRAYVRINSDGLRGPLRSPATPAGIRRIAILGDSMTEAFQVEWEDTFVARLESRLSEACPPWGRPPVQVLSFGVSGYGTAQELRVLRHRVWSYEPDLVMLALFPANDVRNNSRALEGDPLRPYFELTPSGLVLDDSFTRTREYRLKDSLLGTVLLELADHSRVIQLAKAGKVALERRRLRERAALETDDSVPHLGIDPAIYRPPETEDWKRAWRTTEKLLLSMDRESRERGVAFRVVVLSDPVQVLPDPETRRRFVERYELRNLHYADDRIVELGRREEIPVLALARTLRSRAEETGESVHGFPGTPPGFGHWNPRGHRWAAERMAAWLCAPDRGGAPHPPGSPER